MFSSKQGFLLPDAMIALLVVCVTALILSAMVTMRSSSRTTIQNKTTEVEDRYEERIREIECCQRNDSEETADLS